MLIIDTELADEFRAAQLDICAELRRETSYNPSRFEQQVRARDGCGAVEFTCRLITSGPSEGSLGFQRMLQLGRPRQTIEHQVLLPYWDALFEREPRVREVAHWRLAQAGVDPDSLPWRP